MNRPFFSLLILALLLTLIPSSAEPVQSDGAHALGSQTAYLPFAINQLGGPRYGCSYGCPPNAPPGYDCRGAIEALCGEISIGSYYPGNYATTWPQSVTMWMHIPERWVLDEGGEWLMNTPENRPDMLASVLTYVAARPDSPFLLGLEPNGRPCSGCWPVLPERYGEFVQAWLPYLTGMHVGLAGMGQEFFDSEPTAYLTAAFPNGVDVDYVDQHLYDVASADESLTEMAAWRDAYAPGAELIVSEFGSYSVTFDATQRMLDFVEIMDEHDVVFRSWYAFWNSGVVWEWSFLVEADGAPNVRLQNAFKGVK